MLILAGLPKFQRLIEENEQFRERAMATVELQPYRWSHDGDREDFLGATYALVDATQEAGYTFAIEEEDLVRRLYAASGGRIARVVQLLGYTVALEKTPCALALPNFQRMWRTAVQARKGLPNPFAPTAPSDLELERSYILVMQEADLAVPVDNLATYTAITQEDAA